MVDAARVELLQRMPVFGGIRADIVEFLLQVCPLVAVPAGGYFFREQERGDSMFVLQSGEVAVLKSWGQRDHTLHMLGEGDCFGEMAVMDVCPRSASIRAVTDCTAIKISAADLYKIYARDLKQFALIQMNMGREVCRRLRRADTLLFAASMGTPSSAGAHTFLAD